MKRLIVSIFVFVYCLSSFALTENEGIMYVKKYYGLINEYAVTPDNITLAKKIEGMHVGKGYVYPDVEIKLGKLTETEGVGIKTVYLASIMSRQNLLLKFDPQNISIEGNYNGICTMAYTLYVYSGNEKPGQEVFKYSVPLKIEIQNSDKKIRRIFKGVNELDSRAKERERVDKNLKRIKEHKQRIIDKIQDSEKSIHEEAIKAEKEAENELKLEPINYEPTILDLEKEQIDARLKILREEKEAYDKLCSEEAKKSAPTFGF